VIYLYGYLGVGVALSVWVYLESDWRIGRGDAEPAGPLDWDWVVEEVVMPLFVFGWIVICWPLFAYWKVKELTSGRNAPNPVFAVERAHLLEQVSVKEVEARETVFDPLGAAPNRPFGHLHAAWRAFVDRRTDGDELWSFSADWRPGWGNLERRAGYVLVRQGEPGEHFLTVWKDLPGEGGGPGSAINPALKVTANRSG
jgi:hypothetical protein